VFNSPHDLEDGTPTAWSKALHGTTVEPPDYWLLPSNNRARGHNMGRQFGGSGTMLRNLVPLYGTANLEMSFIENKIANEVKSGRQRVKYEIHDIYGANLTGIPKVVHLEAQGSGGLDVDCYVFNVASYEKICSSEEYGG
jgi:hypothetical protein